MLRTLLHGLLAGSMGLAAIASITGTNTPPAAAATEAQLPLAALGDPTPASYWPDLALPTPPQQVSVKLRGVPGVATLASASRLMSDVTNDLGGAVLRTNDLTLVHTLQSPMGIDPALFAASLARDPRVEWAEPVRLRRLEVMPAAPISPNDRFFSTNQKWYYDVLNVPDAWGITTGSSGVTVAIIDSGTMCGHPDLQANIWTNPREIPGNGIDDDGNGFVDDVNGWDFVGSETGDESMPDQPGDNDPCVRAGDSSVGNGIDDDQDGQADSGVAHGTMTAGVVAAVGNNGIGVAGTCWACKLMPVRVANPEGWLRSSDTADAVTYAARNGAKIINMSLGGPQLSEAERAAINTAVSTFGAIIVAAAGNENTTPIAYPARLSNVIAVGASGHVNTKGRAPFSDWGSGTASNRNVDVVAPGVDIVSTAVRSMADELNGSGAAGSAGYSSAAGTSFSAPLVSGVVGLMLSRNPALTLEQVRSILTSTATPLGDDPGDSPNAGAGWAGAGMMNAFAAVNQAGTGAGPTATPTAPSATVTPTAPAATATPSVSPTATVPAGSPTATATPLPAGATPQPQRPPTGATLTDLGTTLNWNIPTGATQYQIQVLPANNDGPAINLIRDIDSSYTVQPPVFGSGPYVMLPGLTYSWRVRTTTATTSVDANSTLWGPWSATSTFKTRAASSSTLSVVQPTDGAGVSTLTPIIRWSNTDSGVFYYEFQLSKDRTFNTDPATATAMVYYVLIHGGVSNPTNSYAVPSTFPLEPRTQYYWRVRPRIQGDGAPVAWSSPSRFQTP